MPDESKSPAGLNTEVEAPRAAYDVPRESRSRRTASIALFAVAASGVLLLGGSLGFDTLLDGVLRGIESAFVRLEAAPAPIYFGVMSVALLAPVPASLFYVTAGPIFGVGTSLLWIAPTLAVNALLVHLISSSMLRPTLLQLIERGGRALPQRTSKRDGILFILLVRIAPGIPYFIQNWVLGLSGVERTPFVLITVAIQMIYAAGFVFLGRSAFEGRFGLAIGALALLIGAGVLARIAHLRLQSAVLPENQP